MTEQENQEAAFLAKITASTTHEVRNVLAIIKESAGLIGDMIAASESGRPLKPERVLKAVAKIDAQVGRGATLLTNLNRVAHGLDHPSERIDLNVEAEQVAMLCERAARLRGHTVEVEPGRDDLVVEAHALGLHMAFCRAVECCLEAMEEPGIVRVRTGRSGSGVTVELGSEVDGRPVPCSPRTAAAWGDLEKLVAGLGATAEPSASECRVTILLPAA
jgi:C4-dicarboxylate-specific signal transduction histidine kinase